MSSTMDLQELITAQRAFFESGKTRSSDFRKTSLERLRSALVEESNALESAMREDLGKPEAEFVTGELGFVLNEIMRVIREMPRFLQPKRVRTPFLLFPARSDVEHEPYGPVLVIAPWNAPLQLALVPAVAAIASGNTVVLKPSEYAPCTAELVARIINRCFDRAYFHVVLGEASVAAELASLRFSYVFFTGSESVGRQVYLSAARNLCPVTLELGGKNPCVVRQDANLRVAARRIAYGKFFNAGQTCVAPNAVFVHSSVKYALLDLLKASIEKFYGNEPRESPDYGRVVNLRHFERLCALLDGVTVYCGGNRCGEERFFAPTLIDEVAEDSPLATDEIFGPILPVRAYDSAADLQRLLDRCRTPLALYVFTEDYGAARDLIRANPAGALVTNDTISQVMNPYLPFGGVGTSGLGSHRGEERWRAFTRPMAVLLRSSRLDPPFRYPPYSRQALASMRHSLKEK